MSEKEVSEKESGSGMEIYLRFGDDMEKDYCFQVTTKSVFRDLLKIFTTLPIALRPNVFYDSVPKGFVVSTAPGYLTEDGALLFSYETGQKRFQKKVALDDTIADHCWPGQLVLPVWEFNSFAFYSFLSFLGAWLYTDLPDFISPTPGHCMTNYVSKFFAKIARMAGYTHMADVLLKDIMDPVGVGAQCIFFFFHIVKVVVIFFVLWAGVFNPTRILRSPFAPKVDVTKEQLISLGWTGSKRANADEYKEHYRNAKIKEYGGMVPAHQAGLFTRLKQLGVFLGEGEGFNTPVSSENTFDDLKEDKLILSYSYFVKLGEHFEKFIKDKPQNEVTEAIKEFRRFGLLNSSEEIRRVVEVRKSHGDSKLSKEWSDCDADLGHCWLPKMGVLTMLIPCNLTLRLMLIVRLCIDRPMYVSFQ